MGRWKIFQRVAVRVNQPQKMMNKSLLSRKERSSLLRNESDRNWNFHYLLAQFVGGSMKLDYSVEYLEFLTRSNRKPSRNDSSSPRTMEDSRIPIGTQ